MIKRPMKGVDALGHLDKLEYPKLVQPKYDGIRVLFYNGTALSSSLKPLANEWLQRFARDFSHKIDGVECEFFVPPSEGGFREATSICRNSKRSIEKGTLWAFDLVDDRLQYLDRYNEVYKIDTAGMWINFYPAPTWNVNNAEEVELRLERLLECKYEGLMLKDPYAMYKHGRATLKSQECLKLKPFVDDDAIIIGWKQECENTNEAYTDELGLTKRSSSIEGKFLKPLIGALQCRCPKFKLDFWVSGFTHEEKELMFAARETLVGRAITFKHQPCDCYDAPRHPIFRRFI